MNLRVAYLVNQYPSTSHTFIRREIHALERLGVEVQRISVRGWDLELMDESDRRERERTRYVLRSGVLGLFMSVLRIALRAPGKFSLAARLALRMSGKSDRPLAVHLAYLAEACVVRKWMDDSKASHLHAHFATNPAEIAMLVRTLGGPPFSFTAHGSDVVDRPTLIGLDETVARAAFVAVVSAFCRSQVLLWIPPSLWDRVFVVRCGLETDYGQGSPPAQDSVTRLVCVGRISKEKGQLLLVDAAARLAEDGMRTEIVLAGDGPMRGEVEAHVAKRSLGAHIRVTGWLDSDGIQGELRRARALVVASLSEGLPVVIMEAMANCRTVIAPYLGGIPELVLHGQTGWLFPPGDVDALALSIRQCICASSESLAGMGALARARVSTLHSVDAEAKKLLLLIEQSSRGGPGNLNTAINGNSATST